MSRDSPLHLQYFCYLSSILVTAHEMEHKNKVPENFKERKVTIQDVILKHHKQEFLNQEDLKNQSFQIRNIQLIDLNQSVNKSLRQNSSYKVFHILPLANIHHQWSRSSSDSKCVICCWSNKASTKAMRILCNIRYGYVLINNVQWATGI